MLAGALGCKPDAEGLEELALACGFLPLTLEIAAARIAASASLTPARLARRLVDATSRLERLSDRERSLRAVFDASFDQLDQAQARMFLLLGSAPGPDISTGAAAVLADLEPEEAEEVLEELEAARLVASHYGDRWAMHDLLADYTRDHPRTPADQAQALGRLLDHYTALVDDANDHLRALPGHLVTEVFPGHEAALAWLDAERAPLVAAALAAPALHHTRAAIALPLRLAEYLHRRRRFEDWVAVSRSAQQTARTASDQAGEAWAWNNLGLALQGVRRFEEAINAHSHARELFQQTGDTHSEASAWNHLGLTLRDMRRFEEAINAQTHARELFQQTEDAHSEALAWNNLGLTLEEASRFEEAITAHTHAREMFQQTGDTDHEATASNNLGLALREVRRFNEAIDAHTHAREIYQQTGDTHSEAKVWSMLGLTLHAAGSLEEAARTLERAVELFTQSGDAHSGRVAGTLLAELLRGGA